MKKNKSKYWWENKGGFFGQNYIQGDNSLTGYIPNKSEKLEDRTVREVKGVIRLLKPSLGAKILDVPCGYGRHSIALAKQGYKVTGIDINEIHLRYAKNSTIDEKNNMNFIKGDMKKIDSALYNKYDAVINMFYSFGFFHAENENLQTMKEFYHTLKLGGKLLIHTDVSPEMISNNTTYTDQIRTLENNKKLVILESYNKKNKRMEGSWEITDASGKVIHPRAFYSVRIYTKNEFTEMAHNCGFTNINFYGSFSGEKFSTNSNEMIMIAEKK